MKSVVGGRWSVAGALCALALFGCTPAQKPAENCSNGVDDDGNGQIDCNDSACLGDPACGFDGGIDAGYYGACAHCGATCTDQLACLSAADGGGWLDTPLPTCLPPQNTSSGSALRCSAVASWVQLPFEVDSTGWGVITPTPKTMNVRFVSKTAVDGSAVTCATVTAVASSVTAPAQIEGSGKFNVLAYDVAPLTQSCIGYTCKDPYLNAEASSAFLIWVEFWGGPRDPTSGLPQGSRQNFACVEGGPAVAPITVADDARDAGTPPRVIHVALPPP